MWVVYVVFFFFKQKTAYEMRISDWSSDVCSSDLAWWWLRARRRRAAIVRLFDERLDAANTPVERVAAMSELLRRAARRRDPAADRLQGDAWLAFLDGDRASDVARPFSEGTGRVLLEGGFRREVDRQSTRLNSSHYCA